MLRAIVASKKKNDQVDAAKIADAVRCDLLPECYMAPQPVRDLRRVLRYRNFLVRTAVRLKNRTSCMLMECGVEFDSDRLHGKRYFRELFGSLEEVPPSVKDMLQFNRAMLEVFQSTQMRLLRELKKNPLLRERVGRLVSIPGVGPVLALTWVLEIGEVERFPSIRRAISYCGLCSAQSQSADKQKRGPLSKQRNKHLQWVLIEAAKLAPQWNAQLAEYHAEQLQRGSRNRATLAVARKLVAYLMSVDKNQKRYQAKENNKTT
jgi:transposase